MTEFPEWGYMFLESKKGYVSNNYPYFLLRHLFINEHKTSCGLSKENEFFIGVFHKDSEQEYPKCKRCEAIEKKQRNKNDRDIISGRN
jgi:hypothetical protein